MASTLEVVKVIPPGLDPMMTRGFHALRGDFMGAPIFDAAIELGDLEYGPEHRRCSLPKDVTIQQGQHVLVTAENLELLSEEEYSSAFTFSVDGKTQGLGFKMSAQSSILHHGNLFTQHQKVYLLNMQTVQVYTVRRNRNDNLAPAFKADLAALPPALHTDEDWMAYRQFFDRYGTHYLRAGACGGYMVMETALEEDAWSQEHRTAITEKVSAKWKAILDSGKLSVASSETIQGATKGSNIQLHYSLYATGSGTGATVADWIRSSWDQPVLLVGVKNFPAPELGPLTDLVTPNLADQSKRDALTVALANYLEENDFGLFGAPLVRWSQEEYLEKRPGFVVGNVGIAGHKTWSKVEATSLYHTNWEGTPTLGRTSVNEAKGVPWASFAFPIRQDATYQTTKFGGTLRFVPMKMGDKEPFGHMKAVHADTDQAAETDGLVLGVLETTVAHRTLAAWVTQPPGKDKPPVKVMTVSVNPTLPGQSFCFPVRRGCSWRLEPHFDGHLYWLPLAQSTQFPSRFLERTPGVVYHAESAGLLFGYVETAGKVTVLTSSDNVELHRGEGYTLLHTAATAQAFKPILAPIGRGLYYRVLTEGISDADVKDKVKVFWLEMTR